MNTNHSFSLFWLMMKLQRIFFAICWRLFMLAYFCIGLGALAMVFLIESQFFIQVTQHPILGYGIAAIFEIAKVGTSIIKQAITIANRVSRVKVSLLIQGVTIVFQIALIVVSLICSMVVVTAYLDGSSVIEKKALLKKSAATGQPIVTATLGMLQEGLNMKVNSATFISVFALLVSALFQATSYIVFGHIIATQSREIEHIFEVKMHRLDTKKNFMPSI